MGAAPDLRPESSRPRRLPAIAERLRHMHPPDILGPREVGDGAGDAEDAVEAAGGEAHRFGGLAHQAAAGLVGGGDGIEEVAVGFGVGADAVRLVAVGLEAARLRYPRR